MRLAVPRPSGAPASRKSIGVCSSSWSHGKLGKQLDEPLRNDADRRVRNECPGQPPVARSPTTSPTPSTTGYKRSGTEFSSLIIPTTAGNYTSGGVTTTVRHAISQQGDLQVHDLGDATSRSTATASSSSQNASGTPFLTRAGSFVPDGEGRLVNAAGFNLMGYSFANGTPSAVANGFGGLEPSGSRRSN